MFHFESENIYGHKLEDSLEFSVRWLHQRDCFMHTIPTHILKEV